MAALRILAKRRLVEAAEARRGVHLLLSPVPVLVPTLRLLFHPLVETWAAVPPVPVTLLAVQGAWD